ncbi:hypothetical protein GC194_02535 [bacterium]|nr:hypothetical protein [bacterium]
MRFFNKNKSDDKLDSLQTQNIQIEMNERPRICCIDIKMETVNFLKKEGYNIYTATLGDKIKVPNKNLYDNHYVLLNFDFPINIHEYDIFLIDLENMNQIDYKPEDHVRDSHTGKSAITLVSSYPETIFDPRPLSSLILSKRLAQIGERNHMVITFTTGDYVVEYETVKIAENYIERQGTQKHGIYSFSGYMPLSEPKFGKEMTVCNEHKDLKTLLQRHIDNSYYNQTFHHPTNWNNGKREPDPSYIPLVKNSSGDIVSICDRRENSLNFYFPQIEDKSQFLSAFLKNVAPSISPELFPFSTTFSWKNNKEYWLPNHAKLVDEKEKIVNEFEEKLVQKDQEIEKNKKDYSFLHEMISETGDELVNATIEFLKWLGFSNAINADELKEEGQVLEEDIQIDFEEGLIIIECKGIGGTSTDSDCSQISKIKHRRCKDRNKFDVFALYIVNHQRYLPPLQRSNPPFNENQIQDAISDERGLLSTWQLFNLYYEIVAGVISKAEARKAIIKFGLIEFKPSNIVFIYEPNEIFKNGTVCIINITDTELKIGDEILIEKNGQFIKAIIEGIQLEDKPVQRCSSGEIGLSLSVPIKNKSKLWKKASSLQQV